MDKEIRVSNNEKNLWTEKKGQTKSSENIANSNTCNNNSKSNTPNNICTNNNSNNNTTKTNNNNNSNNCNSNNCNINNCNINNCNSNNCNINNCNINNCNSNIGDGRSSLGGVFFLNSKNGYIGAKTSIKIDVCFSPIDILYTYNVLMYVKMHVDGGCVVPRTRGLLVASCRRASVRLSKNYLRLATVKSGCESMGRVWVVNDGDTDTYFKFEGVGVDGVFTIRPSCGCVPARGTLEVRVTYAPVYPIIHHRRVPFVVHNVGVDYLQLLASCEGQDTHPYTLDQSHISRYEQLVNHSLSLMSTQQLTAMVDEGEWCFDASASLVVLNHRLLPAKKPLKMSKERMYFDDANSNAAVVFSTQHFSLSSNLLHFRNNHCHDSPFSYALYVTNHTRGQVSAYWSACDCRGVFSVTPTHRIIHADSTAAFTIAFNNDEASKWYKGVLELFLLPVSFEDHSTCDERILFAPWSSVVTAIGNTYKVQCEKLIPKVSFDPSNLQLFFPVHLTSSKPILRTFTITNQTTEPLLFCMQLLEGQNVVGNAYSVLSFKPAEGLIHPLSVQVVVLMLEDDYCSIQGGRTEAKVCKRIRLCLNDDPKNDMIITCLLTYQLPTVMLRTGSGVQWKSCPRFSDSFCVKAGAEESCGGGGGGETNVCIDNFGVCLNNNNNNNSVIGGSNDNTDDDYVERSNVEGNDGGVHKSGNNIGGRDNGEQSNGVVETDGRGVDGKEGNAVSSNNYSSEAMNTNNSAINCSASLNDDHILITKPTNTGNTSRTPSLIINPCLSPLRYKWIVPKHHMKHLSVVPVEGVLKPFEIKKLQWVFKSVFYEKIRCPLEVEVQFVKGEVSCGKESSEVSCGEEVGEVEDEETRILMHQVVLFGSRGRIEAVDREVRLSVQVVAQTTRVPLTSIVNSSHCDLLFKLLLREIPCCCCHCGSSGGGGGGCSDGKASEKHGMPSETKTTETKSTEGVLKLDVTLGKLSAKTSQALYAEVVLHRRRHFMWRVSYVLCDEEEMDLEGRPEEELFLVSVQAVIPYVEVMEATGAGAGSCLSQDFILQLFNVKSLNNALGEEVKDGKGHEIPSVDSYFPKAPMATDPCSFVFTVQNRGLVNCHVRLSVPEDIEESVEKWAQTGELDKEGCRKMQILKNNLFTLQPCNFQLAPGHTCALKLSYKHLLIGHNSLSVRMEIRQGNTVQLNLHGTTLAPCQPSVQLACSQLVVCRTFLGLQKGMSEAFAVYNCSDQPLEYVVNTKPFTALCKANFYQPVLQCLTPRGNIQAGQMTSLVFAFKPIQAKTYTVKTSLMVLASGERVFFEVSGQGINPLSCVPFIPHQGAGIEVEVPLMTLPGQHCQLSALKMWLGDCPLDGSVRRMLTLRNLLTNESLLFDWSVVDSAFQQTVTIEPSFGRVQGSDSVALKVIYHPNGPPAYHNIDLVCETVVESEVKTYLDLEEGWKATREKQRSTVDFSKIPVDYDLDHFLNLETEMSTQKSPEEIKYLRYKTLPPILESANVDEDKKLAKNFAANKKCFYQKPSPPPRQIRHLSIVARCYDAADYVRLFDQEDHKRFFVPQECTSIKEDAGECQTARQPISIHPGEYTILTDVLNDYIREAVESVNECVLCQPDNQVIPFYQQLRKVEKEDPPSYYILTTHANGEGTRIQADEECCQEGNYVASTTNVPNNLFDARHFYDEEATGDEAGEQQAACITNDTAGEKIEVVSNLNCGEAESSEERLENLVTNLWSESFQADSAGVECVDVNESRMDEGEVDREEEPHKEQQRPSANGDQRRGEIQSAALCGDPENIVTNLNEEKQEGGEERKEKEGREEEKEKEKGEGGEDEEGENYMAADIKNEKGAILNFSNSNNKNNNRNNKKNNFDNKNECNHKKVKKELSKEDIKRMPRFQAVLEEVMENCVHNIILESFHNEFNITSRPRHTALPPKQHATKQKLAQCNAGTCG